ncbi:DeoR/GlpR family DNA-binding transcription regulator [Rhodospira trueperi]|uniref:DNA-binding transcriptional regulator of sugar metabolism, DeoR/GlpR family n=1 Tax=Rhodospira trueperi TaxID=69960 RepID=A0A1G7DBV2_9PROT|nr:DeoR/GlpR family DNA-binding transcription regulator [Rhodospira trueperi]SDE48979.1 DNA-binding transcriptional regulator of sugar metabolism, DeoR/GlpR family [Rhodospira trueperi]
MAIGKKTARQRRILEILGTQPTLRVSDLAAQLGVSTETVRRDLDDLTGRGLISRTYGGAVRRLSLEPGLNERHALLVPQRQSIARLAVPFLAGAKHIMIGSGATTVHVSKRLAFEMNNLTVVAHSFGVATVLALNPTITVLMAPGVYHAQEGAVHGAQTARFLEGFRADWAILGASGLKEDGASDALIEAAEVYATMMRRAAQVMVVADSSKFDEPFPARYANWDDIDVLVTETPPKGALAKAIAADGTRVVAEFDGEDPGRSKPHTTLNTPTG